MSSQDPLRQLAWLEARMELKREADEALEHAIRSHLPLEQALAKLMPILLRHTDAEAATVQTFDENLESRAFVCGIDPPAVDSIHDEIGSQGLRLDNQNGSVLAVRIDVAGEDFGIAAIRIAGAKLGHVEQKLALLDTWAEQLDGFLAAISQARRKALVLKTITKALQDPLISLGIDKAIEALRAEVCFDDLLLVFRHSNDRHGESMTLKIIQNGKLTHDSTRPGGEEIDDFIRANASDLITGRSRDLLRRFGIFRFREEVLISGLTEERILGRLVLTCSREDFSTFDRDIIGAFASTLRQRIVDHGRQWKQLSHSFAPQIVRELLERPSFRQYLEPVERDIAILYADIAGFTRISETKLRKPEQLGRLIDVWIEAMVDIVWRQGGVFDKMVGDCVIALWGPPFFNIPAEVICHRAAAAAHQIRSATYNLLERSELEELPDIGEHLGVATGLNFCPALVGSFGPNENYTAFSSGMNNTARLQGVAVKNEILCLRPFVAAFSDKSAFGKERRAQVKNVAEDLRFRELIDSDQS